MTVAIAAVMLVLALHLVLGLYNSRRADDEYRAFLRAEDLWTIGNLRLRVDFDAAGLNSGLARARDARGRDDLPEAQRLLGLAYRIIEEAHPDRQQRLAAMGRMLRLALGIRPQTPLAPTDYALARLGALAGVATVFHHLLVSPVERFALRLGTLRMGFWLAFRVLRGAHSEIGAAPRSEPAWRLFSAGTRDWQCLDSEHLESFKAFAEALRVQTPRAS